MSRFSHRQPARTFGPVVLLSTLLLSPVMASVVLNALIRTLPHGGTAGFLLTEGRGETPPRPERPSGDRANGQPRRPEESPEPCESEEERFLPAPEKEPIEGTGADTRPLTDIALRLTRRVVFLVPDDLRLAALPAPENALPSPEGRPSLPPRAPPAAA
ncbi:MAG: hypothetical protein SFU56_16155 [Capsulimonadales bacterium]|nr:hypothetical protein [Capsulimonadales bacterium]